jgi:hypothetical protein
MDEIKMAEREALLDALDELAEELEKGMDADPSWLKYQGPLVREAITALQEK